MELRGTCVGIPPAGTLLAVLCLVALLLAAQCRSADARARTYEQWVRERAGPVVYAPDDPHGWDALLDLTDKLGCQAIKSWVLFDEPGDGVKAVQAPHFQRMLARFQVIHLNLCLGYEKRGYTHEEGLPRSVIELAEREWYAIARELYLGHGLETKTVLLSIRGELNGYYGSSVSRYPSFPVDRYVNACHAGLVRARESFPAAKLRVYSVAEVQFEAEFKEYVARWFPRLKTDLFSLSFYNLHHSLEERLAWLREHTPASESFGRRNLMLGEYGTTLEYCNWNQAAHVRLIDTILRGAWKQGLQYAFLYELADHERVIRESGHDGLIRWTPRPKPRLAWDYFSRIYHGGKARAPRGESYEDAPWLNDVTKVGPDLVVSKVRLEPTEPDPGMRVAVHVNVKNVGTAAADGVLLFFHADDLPLGWAGVGRLEAGEENDVQSNRWEPLFSWVAAPGRHRLTAVVDPMGRVTETDERNNSREVKIVVRGN